MAKPREELILLIESDTDISDVIVRQTLLPLGYRVKIIDDANKAIKAAIQFSPDLVIANLNSSGLSGKDLLVAFNSQNFEFPIIILARKEQEREVVQTLRLGASDYLLWPARSTEVVAAVEHALKQTRGVHVRRKLTRRLRESDQELVHKTRELKIMLEIGKAVVSISNQRILFEKMVEGAMRVTSADIGWLLLKDERQKKKPYILRTERNLPTSWAKKINKPLDDGISSLVALSGETLRLHGRPLRRFKISVLGKSVAVVPVKVRGSVIGLLIVIRKKEKAFTNADEELLEAISDYISISLVNAKLFHTLQQRAVSSHSKEKRQTNLMESLQNSLQEELEATSFSINLLKEETLGNLNKEQKQVLETTQAALRRLMKTAKQTFPAK